MSRVLPVVLGACAALLPAAIVTAPAHAAAKPVVYKNCDAMHKKLPHGVGRKGARDTGKNGARKAHPVTKFKVDTATYNANRKSDADKDGVACEK